MNNTKLRIGIVGAGGIVRSNHVPGFRALPDCEIVAVCNRTPESSQKAAQELGIPEVEKDWRSLVARKDLNVILIGTWPYMHKDVTIAALKNGKHVLCESRMSRTEAEARAMLDAAKKARKHGLVTMLCPPPTGFKGDYVMRETLESGIIGTPYLLLTRVCNAALLDKSKPLFWRQQLKYQGLNALVLGMLYEALERWFGPAVSVQARTRIFTPKRPLEAGSTKLGNVERPDVISVLAEFKNGMSGTLHFSGVSLHAGPNAVEVFGEKGMIRYNLDEDRIFAATAADKTPNEVPIPPEKARTWRVEAEFVAAIREGKAVSPSFEDGLKYMAFTEAVEKAAKTGRTVKVQA
ncbi:MAG TPA: Gfo/Idh/MocA family oxidoreductase [Planctomycetota bacterium]|nr:Gfo/Idh/MocA family oxidoreductase [Planctomycetota bacterium]